MLQSSLVEAEGCITLPKKAYEIFEIIGFLGNLTRFFLKTK